jgi:hypothetical protein
MRQKSERVEFSKSLTTSRIVQAAGLGLQNLRNRIYCWLKRIVD